MVKILSVFGTRPEAIKMAPVIKEIGSAGGMQSVVCVTAQHRQMLDQALKGFEIKADVDLDIMAVDQDIYEVTGRVLLKMRHVLAEQQPDLVLVQGDTTTTFAASLAAFYAQVPVGHVEAGLRTGNLSAPFPEEANRALVARVAALHFVPTERSRDNLLSENVAPDKIFITGNTGIDALLMTKDKVLNKNPVIWKKQLGEALPCVLSQSKRIILVTGHRRESFGRGFLNICKALSFIAKKHKDVEIIYPVHMNPNVQTPVKNILSGYSNIHLIKPLGYEPFVFLMNRSYLILTDSGGIQEEAPALGKPVLVMRNITERTENIDSGNARLVGTDFARICYETEHLLDDRDAYREMTKPANPYGDGHAAERIVGIIKAFLNRMDPKAVLKEAPLDAARENMNEDYYG